MSLRIDSACVRALRENRTVSGLLCPSCGGGRTGERSVSIWPDDVPGMVVIHCWRNSCEYSVSMCVGENVRAGEQHTRKVIVPDSKPRGTACERFLLRKFGLLSSTQAHWQVRQSADGEPSIVLPVMDHRQQLRGYVLRRYGSARRTAKAISYKLGHGTWQAIYLHPEAQDLVVVVEDQISAMRLWQLGYSAVSLLGTSLSPDKLKDIQSAGAMQILVALDADAFSQSIDMVMRYHANLRPVILWRDIKDSTDAEIRAALDV